MRGDTKLPQPRVQRWTGNTWCRHIHQQALGSRFSRIPAKETSAFMARTDTRTSEPPSCGSPCITSGATPRRALQTSRLESHTQRTLLSPSSPYPMSNLHPPFLQYLSQVSCTTVQVAISTRSDSPFPSLDWIFPRTLLCHPADV